MEYIYLLSNNSYGSYVVKIGKTTVEPIVRAKQLYWGATGVPEHFSSVFVCSVPDCHTAEKKIHQYLKTYRINKRREFFKLPIETAKISIFNTCKDLFGADNVSVTLNEETKLTNAHKDVDVATGAQEIDIDKISLSGIGSSKITPEQRIRISVIEHIMSDVFLQSTETWEESFSRDLDPEREIIIWENIAKTYLKVGNQFFATEHQKKEAFSLLLERSMRSKSNTLKNWKGEHLSNRMAKELLNAYELKPMPLIVVKNV